MPRKALKRRMEQRCTDQAIKADSNLASCVAKQKSVKLTQKGLSQTNTDEKQESKVSTAAKFKRMYTRLRNFLPICSYVVLIKLL